MLQPQLNDWEHEAEVEDRAADSAATFSPGGSDGPPTGPEVEAAEVEDRRHLRDARHLTAIASGLTPLVMAGSAYCVGGVRAALVISPIALAIGAGFYKLGLIAIREGLASDGVPGMRLGGSPLGLLLSRAAIPLAISNVCLVVVANGCFAGDIDRVLATRDLPVLVAAYDRAQTAIENEINVLRTSQSNLQNAVKNAAEEAREIARAVDGDNLAVLQARENLTKAEQALACEEGGASCENSSNLKGHAFRAERRQVYVGNAEKAFDTATATLDQNSTRLKNAQAELADAQKKLGEVHDAIVKAQSEKPTTINAVMASDPTVQAARKAHGQWERLNVLLGVLASWKAAVLTMLVEAGLLAVEISPLLVALRLPSTTLMGARRTALQARSVALAAAAMTAAKERIFAARERVANVLRTSNARRRAAQQFDSEFRRQSKAPQNLSSDRRTRS